MSVKTTSFWRNLTNIWTVVFFAAIIYDFHTGNALDNSQLLLPIAVIYDAVLAVYSADKEFKRWHDNHETVHPGELYVIAWTILIFGLLALAVISHYAYHVPAEVSSSYIVAVGILAVTRESKHLYKREVKNQGKKK
jgi:Flp pilus assembly protein TadB